MRLWLESVCLTTITTIILILVAIGPNVLAQRIISNQSDVDFARLSEKVSGGETALATMQRKVEKLESEGSDTRLELATLNGRMQGFGAAVVGLQLLHLGLLIFGRRKEH